MFRSALRPGGHLFLAGSGPGEIEAFVPVSRRCGIYRRFRRDDPASTPLTVCVDTNLLLKWFTGSPGPLGPRASEVGASLEGFAASRGDLTLVDDAKTTLLKGGRIVREVRTAGGRWYERQTSAHREGILVTYSDIEARKGAAALMESLTDELERRVDARTRNLKLLRETLAIANRAESFGQALRGSLDCISHELGWPIAHAWLRANESDGESERRSLVDSGVWSLPSPTAFARFVRASRQMSAAGLPWRAIESGAPCWVSDVATDGRSGRPMGELVARGVRGALFVPIRVGNRIAGVLEFFTNETDEPAKLVIDALGEIGGQLGRVLERERSEKALHRMSSELLLAEERERGQLAADLHDDLGQLLALARMRVDALLSQAPPESAAALQRISDILGRANEAARTVTFRLSPPMLRELGLVPALQWLGENLPAPDGVEIRVSADTDVSALSESARLILFRCTRELLMNAVRHAGASVIRVEVGRAADSFTIVVADDGKRVPHRSRREGGRTLGSVSSAFASAWVISVAV
jgi:signal transduction histidine kinase